MEVVRATAVAATVDFGGAVQITYECPKTLEATRRNVKPTQAVGIGHGASIGKQRARQARGLAAAAIREKRT